MVVDRVVVVNRMGYEGWIHRLNGAEVGTETRINLYIYNKC